VILPKSHCLVSTGIAMATPTGTYGRIAPRSGLAVKHGIHIGAGVIDSDYRGPVKVVMFNLGNLPFEIQQGDRIAQLILEKISVVDVIMVDNLEGTVRNHAGFGSTGTK
jgi:dUTP pyrophosphatase